MVGATYIPLEKDSGKQHQPHQKGTAARKQKNAAALGCGKRFEYGMVTCISLDEQ